MLSQPGGSLAARSQQRILLSYRRNDTAAATGRIYDRLGRHFGKDRVVIDVDSVPLGADFRKYLADVLSDCRAVVVVIGNRWLEPTVNGARRLDDERDFVRFELETALARGIPLFPVLVDAAEMPREADLPPTLANFAYINALKIDLSRDFHHHMDKLVADLPPDRRPTAQGAASETPDRPDATRSLAPTTRKAKRSPSRKKSPLKPNAAFMKPLRPSPALAKLVGKDPLTRTEVVKKIWTYVKKNGLQDKKEKRNINADDILRDIFGGKRTVSMFEMTKLVNDNLD